MRWLSCSFLEGYKVKASQICVIPLQAIVTASLFVFCQLQEHRSSLIVNILAVRGVNVRLVFDKIMKWALVIGLS